MISFRHFLTRLTGASEASSAVALQPVVVRELRAEDRAAVLRIEAASFPDAWTPKVLDAVLAQTNVSAHVLERARTCVAFFVVGRERDRLHLMNLGVAPEARRRGLGARALQAVEKIAWAYGLPLVVLEVRETNLAAQLLYRSSGYRAVEIVRAYYGDEDAYRMTKSIRLPGRNLRTRSTSLTSCATTDRPASPPLP